MNHVTASCGHQVPAEGAPGSMARKAQERRHCGMPRCESGLPAKFSDRECAAYVWMWNQHGPWLIDVVNKKVWGHDGNWFENLIEFAKHFGWDG